MSRPGAAPLLRGRHRDWPLLGVLLAVAILVVLPFLPISQFASDRVTQAVIFIGLTISWNILGGFAGQLSLGHAAFFGVGAYTAAEFTRSTSLGTVPVLLFAIVAAAAMAVFVIPCFRARGAYFAILTLALAAIVGQLAERYAPGANNGIFFDALPVDSNMAYVLAAGGVAFALALSLWITRSRLGQALDAVRLDLDAARSVGVGDFAARTQALLLSAALAGYFGGVYALTLGFLDPATAFSLDWSVGPLLGVVLGGIGTVFGPLIGGGAWSAIEELLSELGAAGAVSLILQGSVLLAITLIAPRGTVGIVSAVYERIWRRRPRRPRRDAAETEEIPL